MKFGKVAIASFPRSGNTWLRHLLFNAAGLKSSYNFSPETAIPHKAGAIHLIEDIHSKLVKTHDRDAREYEAAIHVIRNPVYALASYLDYMHVFGNPITRRREFIEVEARGWAKHTEYWRMSHTCGVLKGYLMVQFEDLLREPENVLSTILCDFLAIETEPGVISQAVQECSLENMQKKGSKDFFPQGGERKAADTLSPDEIKVIHFLTEKERKQVGYFS